MTISAANSLSRDENKLLMLILDNLNFELRHGINVDRSYFSRLVNKRKHINATITVAQTDAQSTPVRNPLSQVANA